MSRQTRMVRVTRAEDRNLDVITCDGCGAEAMPDQGNIVGFAGEYTITAPLPAPSNWIRQGLYGGSIGPAGTIDFCCRQCMMHWWETAGVAL